MTVSFRWSRRLVLAGLLCFAAPSVPLKADGWAFGGFVGGAATHQNTLTLEQSQIGTRLSLGPVKYDSESLHSPIYYGYRVTWFARRHFGLEGEFIHPKVFARTSQTVRATGMLASQPLNGSVQLDSIVQRFSISHGLNFLLVNAVFRHPLDEGATPRLWLTARGGAGVTIPHTESDIGGRVQEQYERGAPGVQAAIGSEVRITEHVLATIEYKFTTTEQSVSIDGGTIRGRFTSQHFTVGMTWHP